MANPSRSAQISPSRRWARRARPFAVLALVAATTVGAAERIAPGNALRFVGTIHHADDLSAIAVVGKFLIIGSDEGGEIQVLEPTDEPDTFRTRGAPIRLRSGTGEIDIEAMASSGGTLYVAGSHSVKRKLLDPDKGYAENRARLATVSPEPDRQWLFRLEIDPETGLPVSSIDAVTLRPVLQKDPILAPFTLVPAAENGVDIEGLAVDGDELYLGFRSPVLREGYVPVMTLRFEDPQHYALRFVQLRGSGIRSMARVPEGFLILARPERGGRDDNVVYLWNGRDEIPGAGGAPVTPRRVGKLEAPPGGTPEGLAIVSETARFYEAIVIHDGLPGGSPRRVRLARSPQAGHSTR